MKWIQLESVAQLADVLQQQGVSIIFKHSTRCSISMMAKRKFEMDWDNLPADTNLYFLDLIKYRDVSSAVAEALQVHHESPQLLLIRNGECILDLSHADISVDETLSVLN